MRLSKLNPIQLGMGSLLLGCLSLSAAPTTGLDVLNSKCSACHTMSEDNEFSRISNQRKTPEGWFMTVSRMQASHGLSISEDEKKAVVKYLADTQGITPSESKKYRYILEQTPNVQEEPHETLFTEMCVRCHSAARVGLQRRTTQEWEKLVNFHLGQFPTTEYQALARDREWLSIAKDTIIPSLGKEFGLSKTTWKAWQDKAEAINIAGSYRLSGHTLGAGDFEAIMTLKETSEDNFEVSLEGEYLDGRPLVGSGKAIIYSGYEYRALLDIAGISFKQVFAFNEEAQSFEGRMFETLHPEEGSEVQGVSLKSKEATILSVSPQAIKAGNSEVLTIVGHNLDGKIKLPSSLKLEKVISQSKDKVKLLVSSSLTAQTKTSTLRVGSSKTEVTTYQHVDSMKVFPSYAIARVGDGGGSMPKQHAVFEAYGYAAGQDGKVGTKDDIALGVVDATWRVEPFDETAKHDEDIKYAGKMDSLSGRFTPSFAGPNPKRKFSTNNAGNLKVVATLKDSEKRVEADSHLIVTVQKWVNPPIN